MDRDEAEQRAIELDKETRRFGAYGSFVDGYLQAYDDLKADAEHWKEMYRLKSEQVQRFCEKLNEVPWTEEEAHAEMFNIIAANELLPKKDFVRGWGFCREWAEKRIKERGL